MVRLRETGPNSEIDPVAHAAACLMQEAANVAGVPHQDSDASKTGDSLTQQSLEGETESSWPEKHPSWRRQVSRRTGRAYYINLYTGQARWAPDDESATAVADLNTIAKSAADIQTPTTIRIIRNQCASSTTPDLETAVAGGNEALEVGARVLDDLPLNWVQVRPVLRLELACITGQ